LCKISTLAIAPHLEDRYIYTIIMDGVTSVYGIALIVLVVNAIVKEIFYSKHPEFKATSKKKAD
jgi:hypothetical protein